MFEHVEGLEVRGPQVDINPNLRKEAPQDK